MSNIIFWILLIAWQLVPFCGIGFARRERKLSWLGAGVAVVLVAVGTVWAFREATSNESSTAPLLILWSPVYLSIGVLLVVGVDAGVRRIIQNKRTQGATDPHKT